MSFCVTGSARCSPTPIFDFYPKRSQPAYAPWRLFAARHRRGKPISTAFLDIAVGEIIAKRMNKKQQMRCNQATVEFFLDVRTAVLNDTLEDTFRSRQPGFQTVNDDHRATAAAA